MGIRLAQVVTSDMSVKLLLTSQIRALAAQGFDVSAVCAPGKWVSEIRAGGIPVLEVPMVREISLTDLRSLLALVRCFTRQQFTVVNTHTPKAGILGPLAARLARVPIIIHTVHGFLFHDQMPWRKQFLFRLAERFTALCSHYLFFQSHEDLEVARRLGFLSPERLFYIGNGIDVMHFRAEAASVSRPLMRQHLGYGPEDFVVGLAARLTYEKGFREFFAAIRLLLDQRSGLQFLVIGPVEPDQKDAVKPEEIEAMARTGRVRFLGMRRDMRELFSALDLFVLPSHREGIPRALMEACAMGVPVVASNIRGCREVVADGVSGLLVPVFRPNALAAAILKVASLPDRGQAMGQAARQRIVTHFDDRLVNQRISAALTAILEQRVPNSIPRGEVSP